MKQGPTKVERNSMYGMRESGATLQQIADHYGISREWVRQLMFKRYGSSRPRSLLDISEVSRLTGCTRMDIFKLKRRGIIKPSQVVGRGRTLWTHDTVDIVKKYRDSRRCKVCDGPLPNNHWVFCSWSCWVEASRFRNRNRTQLQKNMQKQRMARYFAKKAKERYQSSQYIVRQKCAVPLGTKLNVIGTGSTKRRLRVEWNGKIIEIPSICVKRVFRQSQ